MSHRRSSIRWLVALLVAGCGATEQPPAKEKRTYNFHAMAGVSMGAIGTSWLTAQGNNASRLDAIGAMGGPVDAVYFLSNMERNLMGGFCSLAELEALAATDPAKLDDPSALDCGEDRAFFEYELEQSFHDWAFTANGGRFDRSEYLEIFEDLSLAMGNPLSAYTGSGVFPFAELTKERFATLCTNPLSIHGVKHREFNPEGTHALVSFCDGEEPVHYCDDAERTPVDFCSGLSPAEFCAARGAQVKRASDRGSENPDLFYQEMGRLDRCFHHTEPVPFGLAVDVNGNGRRDYHEPIVTFSRERFVDTGSDGCANDKEDGQGGCTATGSSGDPNKDDFSMLGNPLGTENNMTFDAGEPYDDVGLDGVGGTTDFGEGNGAYDDSPHRKRWLERDLRRRLLSMTKEERRHLDVYLDGGIRDVFNLGLSADIVYSALHALDPASSRRYTSFLDMPEATGAGWNGVFDGLLVDYDKLGRNVMNRYGSESPTKEAIRAGDGDHVGDGNQIIHRFSVFLKWMSHVWQKPLGEPSRNFAEAKQPVEEVYFSEALGAPRNFLIATPAGYDLAENANKRYPVLYLLHGYGMEAGGMASLQILLQSFMSNGDLREMIVVYPSGRCCFVREDGTKDCRETNDAGEDLARLPGYTRECLSGNFYVNRVGYVPGDETRYGDALLELMSHVDEKYRVLAPMTVEVGE